MSHSVKIYQHSNFSGTSHNLVEGEFSTIPSVGNDRISSIKVAKGYYAEFFFSQGFQGKSIYLFAGNYKSLPSWGDAIGSAKVFKHHNDDIFQFVTFYQHSDFKGYSQTLAATGQNSEYMAPFFNHDTISSIKVPEATTVILYEHSNLGGKSLTLKTGEYKNLGIYGWDNKASSVVIKNANLILTKIEYMEETAGANGDPIAITNTIINKTTIDQVEVTTLSRELTQSITRSWTDATLVGMTASISSSLEVSSGITSSSISASISSTLENTLTIGEEETESETIAFEKSINVKIPPQTISKVTALMTPKKYTLDVIYTFKVDGTNKTITQQGEIIVDTYQEGETVIESDPVTTV